MEKMAGNLRRPIHDMPSDVARTLKETGTLKPYNARPAYQRNDYLGWIQMAKSSSTRQRRLAQMVEELRDGHLYMKMPYKAAKPGQGAGAKKSGAAPLPTPSAPKKEQDGAKAVDAYIASFPKGIQDILNELRAMLKALAPEATETISYAMPCLKMRGPIVYYAAFKNHIGFYPLPDGIEEFQKELSGYRHSKGCVQFGLEQKLPKGLIAKIVRYRKKKDGE